MRKKIIKKRVELRKKTFIEGKDLYELMEGRLNEIPFFSGVGGRGNSYIKYDYRGNQSIQKTQYFHQKFLVTEKNIIVVWIRDTETE